MDFVDYADRELLLLELAGQISSQLRGNLRAVGNATLTLPGGSTPAPLIDALSAAPLEWGHVTVFPGDERCLPLDHNRSNYRLIRRHLLEGPAAAAQVIPLFDPADDTSPGAAAEAAAHRIDPHLPITVLLLGMGTDMHTASMFPNGVGLDQALAGTKTVVEVEAPDGERRLTLTAPTLRAAQAIHLMIFGRDKREAFERAASLDAVQAPIRAVWPELIVHWAE
ncbi:MAG: 6-phosphogluconolactonase [Paracoccus denitrificans]|nr:MAG: 6-phosphogluconolactonase [Paracoccus denitrificans]PZO84066.1 MAG: 6-phosphogluconolactonase [Paracoccus denitrificans]